jgi:hypothetical protein
LKNFTKKTNRGVGRPPKELSDEDWKKINQYLQAQCDGSVIATLFGLHPQTFYDKVVARYGDEFNISNFTAYQQIKRREGLELLKGVQFSSAMSGNTTMQIWLGKQLLAQRDQIEQRITVPQVHVQPLNDAEQLEISTAIGMLQQDNESNGDIHTEPEGGSIE